MINILLSIAGFDPTSGAGAALDIKVFHNFGFYGMAILTSLTSQNTQGVKKIHCSPPEFVRDQYQALDEDVEFAGIKVGMLGCKDNIPPLEKILADNSKIPKIIDPVFRSSSGAWLIEKEAVQYYMKTIRGKASLFTPNREEASCILGAAVERLEDMEKAAEQISDLTRIPCLIKGGHLNGQTIDVLHDSHKTYRFMNKRLERTVHGTGCFLSSCILCYLAKDFPLYQACQRAIHYTHQALQKSIQIGQGQALFSFPLKN